MNYLPRDFIVNIDVISKNLDCTNLILRYLLNLSQIIKRVKT